MVNKCEALINVVTQNQRKMLIALGPKGTWSGYGAPNSPYAVVVPPAERRALTHTVTAAERDKPVVFPGTIRSLEGGLARGADETAGTGGGSKRRPICNGSDRG